MSLEGNCSKSGQTKWIFFMMLPVSAVLYMLCLYRVVPPLAAIIAARCHGMLTTRHWKRSTGISPCLSSRAWQGSPRFWGGSSILVIARPNSSQVCSMGMRPGDLAGCYILVTFPCWREARNTRARWGVVLSLVSPKCWVANWTKVFRRRFL